MIHVTQSRYGIVLPHGERVTCVLHEAAPHEFFIAGIVIVRGSVKPSKVVALVGAQLPGGREKEGGGSIRG